MLVKPATGECRAHMVCDTRAMATIIDVGARGAKRLNSFRRELAQSDAVARASNPGRLIVARVFAASGQRMRDGVMRVLQATQCEDSGTVLDIGELKNRNRLAYPSQAFAQLPTQCELLFLTRIADPRLATALTYEQVCDGRLY
jgi:hypothetical protein